MGLVAWRVYFYWDYHYLYKSSADNETTPPVYNETPEEPTAFAASFNMSEYYANRGDGDYAFIYAHFNVNDANGDLVQDPTSIHLGGYTIGSLSNLTGALVGKMYILAEHGVMPYTLIQDILQVKLAHLI
ncbi:hypothetical protein ACQCT6_10425 [Cytobacillus gottheilii]|uniref:hypothetical protein n=1 Tax=Cytobacillus gottheilii TaxID=859144 RepID=UPI003CF8C15E